MNFFLRSLLLSICLLLGNSSFALKIYYPPTYVIEEHVVQIVQPTFFLPGMKIIHKGQLLLIIIPTDNFFRTDNQELLSNKIGVIKEMANYVRNYSHRFAHPVISVTGYTDSLFPGLNGINRSQEYAEVIGSYLWNAGISPFKLSIQGNGAENQIASNLYPAGSRLNRRVEVLVHF